MARRASRPLVKRTRSAPPRIASRAENDREPRPEHGDRVGDRNPIEAAFSQQAVAAAGEGGAPASQAVVDGVARHHAGNAGADRQPEPGQLIRSHGRVDLRRLVRRDARGAKAREVLCTRACAAGRQASGEGERRTPAGESAGSRAGHPPSRARAPGRRERRPGEAPGRFSGRRETPLEHSCRTRPAPTGGRRPNVWAVPPSWSTKTSVFLGARLAEAPALDDHPANALRRGEARDDHEGSLLARREAL